MMKRLLFLLLLPFMFSACTEKSELPNGFVYLRNYTENIREEVRYFGPNNFVGQPVNGYDAPIIICTKEAAKALANVEKDLSKLGLGLLVYDAYRPQRAVNHFVKWASDISDTLTKQKYYPQIDKSKLIELNYIAAKSSHSRGSTFDLTLVNSKGQKVDMGSDWDFFGEKSWPTDTTISKDGQENRNILREAMINNGFLPYREEWWHFTLAKEPFSDTYFDFVVQ